MKRILLAYDGSDPSRRAAEQAAFLAAKQEAALNVLVVGELAPGGYGGVAPVVDPEIYEGVAAEGLELVRGAVPDATAKVVWGKPGDEIVEAAEEGRYDAVIMGHRGKGGLGTLLLGSVAKHVIDRAPCSVLVVR